jgi:NADH dehydrogenase (ubiquinone) 1 alpha subcomplex subunit 2
LICQKLDQLGRLLFKIKVIMSAAIKFGSRLKEVRIHLCQKSPCCQGVRDFIEQHYVSVKSNNPKVPILIRECSGVEPKLWARHGKTLNDAIIPLLKEFSQN